MDDHNTKQNPTDDRQYEKAIPQIENDSNKLENPIIPKQSLNIDNSNVLHPENSPGRLILQWLTYAFWGWAIVSVIALISLILRTYIIQADETQFSPYAVAATLVLLPVAIITDFIYHKHEAIKKTGGASIIMVIHAVLFGVLAVGSLIAIVFSIVSMFTTSNVTTGQQILLYTSLFSLLFYVLLFLRVISPHRPKWYHKTFMIFMGVAIATLSVIGIIGPAFQARLVRNDNLITTNINDLSDSISSYYSDNGNLPNSLSQLNTNGDVNKLISQNLVEYTPNTNNNPTYCSSSGTTSCFNTRYVYYQLCVNYKKADTANQDLKVNTDVISNSGSINTYGHPAGRVCYKVQIASYVNQ